LRRSIVTSDQSVDESTDDPVAFLARVFELVSPEHRPLTVAPRLVSEPVEELLANLVREEMASHRE
jgi:hypothetical protein